MFNKAHKNLYPAFIIFLRIFFSTFVYGPFVSTSLAADFIGLISRLEGKVEIIRGGKQPMTVGAAAGDKLSEKDAVVTKEGAKAEIVFSDNSTVRMAEQSRIEIEEYMEGNRAVLKMPVGKVKAIVPPRLAGKLGGPLKGNRFEIKTPGAVAGVRGTEFFVFQQDKKAEIIVQEGTVATYNPKYPEAIVLVNHGNMTVVAQNLRPLRPRPASAELIKSFDEAVTPPGEALHWEMPQIDDSPDSPKSRDGIQINPSGKPTQQPDKQRKNYDLKDKGYKIKASL